MKQRLMYVSFRQTIGLVSLLVLVLAVIRFHKTIFRILKRQTPLDYVLAHGSRPLVYCSFVRWCRTAPDVLVFQLRSSIPCADLYNQFIVSKVIRKPSDSASDVFEDCLNRFRLLQSTVRNVDSLAHVPFDISNESHLESLKSLWRTLFCHESDPAWDVTNDDRWMSVGFQQSRPYTDFRGAGYFGLVFLNHYCTDVTIQEWANSVEMFCPIVLGLTTSLLGILRDGGFDDFLVVRVDSHENESENLVINLFAQIITDFVQIYLDSGIPVMEFEQHRTLLLSKVLNKLI